MLLVRAISRSVAEVNTALSRLAQGDLTVRANIITRDEIGRMAESLNATVARLRDTLDGVSQASARLAVASASLQSDAEVANARSQAQTENVMQVSAAMEELTVSVSEISSGAENVAQAATESKQLAEDSGQYMQKNDVAMTRALSAVSSSSATVAQLSDAIGKISEITKVIEDIAGQTNLLALNAAIEAARAGEQGRGFAVVADEVRKLAERTTASTADITAMIKAVSERAAATVTAMAAVSGDVEEGAAQTRQLGESFTRIVAGAVSVMELVAEMSVATKEQTQVATQTSQSMETISRIVEETGATIANFADTARSAAETATELDRLVGQFKTA
jgi:methyl-accepting chemotaxis protein